MKKFLKKSQLTLLISLFFFSCETKNGISLIYLFDISGSFHKTALPASVDLAKKLFEQFSNNQYGLPIKPQLHQVAAIDEQSVEIGNDCYTKVEESNIFDDEKTKVKPNLEVCLEKIKLSKRSLYTDLDGALLTASQALQTSNLYGKGLIIFSDLHEDVPIPKTYNYDLNNVSILIVYELSNIQIKNPGLFEEDKEAVMNKLTSNGADPSRILFRNLKSLNTSPEEAVSFFRKSFKN